MKRVNHEKKHNMELVQYEKSTARKEWNTRENCNTKECDMEKSEALK